MRTYLILTVLALVMLGMSGCIVVHTEKVVPCRPVVEPEGVTVCEIDAAGDPASATGDPSGLLTDRP